VEEKITFDYRKLRGRITELYGNQTNFADATNINRTWLCTKLKSGKPMCTIDMVNLQRALDIPDSEVHDYFFTRQV